MILANFSLSFFTSIPGMLITGGVLLLLIALIIFIVTGNKDKKKKKDEVKNEVSDAVATTPSVDVAVSTEEAVNNLNQVNPTVETPTVTTPPVNTTLINGNTTVNNTASPTEGVTPSTAEPITVVSSENTVTPDDNISSNVQASNSQTTNVREDNSLGNVTPSPVVTPTVNVVPNDEVKPVVNPEPTPSVVPTIEPAAKNEVNVVNKEVETPVITVNQEPEVEVAKQPEEHKSIYGGVSSVIPNINVNNDVHRPIYGGADPLENTQSIPTVHNIPVETPKPEVEPVIPKVEVATTPSVPPKEEVNTTNKEEEVESLF